MPRFSIKPFFILLALLYILLPHISYSATIGKTPGTASYRQGQGINSGLVGWWTMDGADISGTQIYDKSASKVSITKYGPTMAAGKIGQGISCNGTTDYAASGYNTLGSSGYITVAAWIKFRTVTGGTIIAVDRSTDWRLMSGNSYNASAMWSSTVDPRGTNLSGNTTLKANTWYHIAFTFDGANAKVWLNGVVDGTKVATGALNTINTFTTFCTYSSHDSNFLNGWLDDVRVYNRALAPSEIKQLYAQGLATVGATPNKTSYRQGQGINSGLVGWWTFDGADISGTQVYDKSGQGTVGTMTGGITKTIGKLGQALNFNGTSDYINLGSNAVYAIADDLSLSAWIYPTNVDADRHAPIISKRHGWSLYLFPGNGTTSYLEYEGFNGTDWGNNFYSNSAVITKNRWQHVALSFAATSTATLYVNGVAVGSKATAGGHGGFYENLLIGWGGSQEWGTPPYFAGKIDDVRVYSRALSAAEIKQLYTTGLATVGKTPGAESYKQGQGINSGLVGWWTFDANNGTLDMSGRGNNGAIVGGVTKTMGKSGQAFKFDGTTGYVNLGSNASLSMSSQLTISAWVNPQVFNANNTVVGSGEYLLQFDSGYAQFWPNVNEANFMIYFTNSVNKWQHVVATFDYTTKIYTVYYNGILKGTETGTQTSTSAGTVYIGTYGGGGRLFTGSIDDVRVYSRVLSAQEVQQLYQMGK